MKYNNSLLVRLIRIVNGAFMIQTHLQLKITLCLFTLMILFSNSCQAQHLKSLNDISSLEFNNESIQVTAPYSILENTKFTSQLNSFSFEHYLIKVINRENPDDFILKITKNSQNPLANNSPNFSADRLPWWSTSAPSVLKTLDFSKIDGSLDEYKIGEHHRLKLLGKQGAWGKVYMLESIDNRTRATPMKICAVKVLLTRKDKPIKDVQEFRNRHQDEIKNNFILVDRNIDISTIPYGMLKNDEDHYLIFLELGQNAYDVFKEQSTELTINALFDLVHSINKLHLTGIAHGDLNVRNMLFFDKQIKFCDWFSLNDYTTINLKKYRYIGDFLAPEAMRALYFGKNDNLNYSIVNIENKKHAYFLHPIAADRFCLGISLLEIIAPDLYKQYDSLNDKDFNPWAPKSLDFWEKHANYIERTQTELVNRASKVENWKLAELYKQASQFISLDPMKRNCILSEKQN